MSIKHHLRAGSRASLFPQSEIRNMTMACAEVGGINMAQGVCDLPLPDAVGRGAKSAIDEGFNIYTRYDGLAELRQAVAQKALRYNKIECDPEKNVVVSCGASGVFYAACLGLFDPGDEVVVFEPYYGYHVSTLKAVGATPVFVGLVQPEWSLDFKALEAAVTPRTKAILVNTPSNPAGKVFSREELRKIGELAVRHDIFIIVDEIYEYFVYDRLEHVSLASMPEFFDRTITISGHSKTFSVTGWRTGYCICHKKWKEAIGHMNDLVYVCAPAPLQMGVAKGLAELPDEYYSGLRTKLQVMRDKICDVLASIGLPAHVPQGAYYALADVSSVKGSTSRDKAMRILEKTGVAAVPGQAFFSKGGGDNLVRFCFAKKDAIFDKAMTALAKYQRD